MGENVIYDKDTYGTFFDGGACTSETSLLNNERYVCGKF